MTDNAPAPASNPPPAAPEPTLLQLAQQEADAPETDEGTKQELDAGSEESDDDAAAVDDEGNPIEEEADEDDGTEEVEWNDGKKYRVPRELKDGYLRQADYTRKTQEVAETRKHVEAARTAVQLQAKIIDAVGPAMAHRQDAIAKLQQLESPEFQARLAQLKATDYLKAQEWRDYRADLERYVAKIDNDIQSAASELQIQQQQETARQLEYMNRVLQTKMPGWGQKRADQISEAMVKHYGFTIDEVASIREPRVVALADDARKWREHVANQKPKQPGKTGTKAGVQPTEKLSKGAAQGGIRKDPSKMTDSEYYEARMAEIRGQRSRDSQGRFR